MQSVRDIILREAKAVRRFILRENGGDSVGACIFASEELQRSLDFHGIKCKTCSGVFKVDKDEHGIITDNYHDFAHDWVEWNGIPIDITADQFNKYLFTRNKVKAIVFDTNLDRYLDWKFKQKYI